MNLYVPVGRASDIGRKRPYKIGYSADVATAQNIYPSITPLLRKSQGERTRTGGKPQGGSIMHVKTKIKVGSPTIPG